MKEHCWMKMNLPHEADLVHYVIGSNISSRVRTPLFTAGCLVVPGFYLPRCQTAADFGPVLSKVTGQYLHNSYIRTST